MNKKEKSLQADLPKGFQNQWGNPLLLKKELLKIIEKNFIKFGYSPLESSLMQLSSIIGNSLSEDEENPMSDIYTYSDDGVDVSLRYDLSQPLINFYKQNYKNLPNPYKRYEMGNVFRREKPGSSRYRSFGQCDVDIIGNFDVKQANADLCSIIGSILTEIINKSEFVINVSNRKIVLGLMDQLKIIDQKQKQKVLRAIDKLDKPGFGIKGVADLLGKERVDQSGAVTKGANLNEDQSSKIIEFLNISDIKELKQKINNPLTNEGIKELEDLFEVLKYGKYAEQVKFTSSTIRGMDIYQGTIIETNLKFDVKNSKGKVIDPGAIISGGEYFITKFKGDPFRGTGISIGIDRLVFCLSQKDRIKIEEKKPVLVCVMVGQKLSKYYEILKILRDNNINSEIYLESEKKLSKQLDYASKRGLSLAIICGEDEFKENTITIKNLKGVKGENQIQIPRENLINEVKKYI
jgi:histidyl-tRNA synthetase